MPIDGLNPYSGGITYGLRGEYGGENAKWGIDPKTGKETPVFGGYLLSDLMQKFGSIEAIRNYGSVTPGSLEWYQKQAGLGDDQQEQQYLGQGQFAQDIDRFGARPNNDTFSGKDGLRDLATIAAMAGTAFTGGFGLGGAEGAGVAGGAAAGDAAAGTAALGSGIAPSSTSALTLGTGAAAGGEALGGGLSTAAATEGVGAGAAGGGLAGAAPAGTAFAPGFFGSEGAVGAIGAGGAAGGTGGGGASTGTNAGSALAPAGVPSLAQIAAGALPAAFGAYGAKQQSDAYGNLAGQYMAMGAPYRSRLSDLYSDPESFLNSKEVQIPIQQGTNLLARSLSRGGNPVGSGNALQELQNYASNQLFSRLGQEKDRLAGFGGLSAYNQAAPGAAGAEIGAQKGIYDAIGAGAADIFNPPRRYTLQDIYGAR